MSSTIFFYRDSRGNLTSLEVDPSADSTELGDKIKAAVAKHEEDIITPTVETFPPLPNTSNPAALSDSSDDRAGVAPEERDSALIPSLRDQQEIEKQEKQRSLVKTWLSSSDAGDQAPATTQISWPNSLTQELPEAIYNSGSQNINLARAAQASRESQGTGDDDHRSDRTGSRTSLSTPNDTAPTIIDGDARGLTGTDKPIPKRLDSTSMANSMTYQQKAAEFDTQSISATVGSRKTIESIYDGSSVKDLSLSENKGRERGVTLTDKFRSLMPRRSNSKLSTRKKDTSPTDTPADETFPGLNHKRGLSTSSLMPPESDSTSFWSHNTATNSGGYLTTIDRRTSDVADTSGATSPLNRLRRSFSKGEKRKSFTENGSTPHIVDLMRKEGGPPVSTALVSPLHEQHNNFEVLVPDPVADDEDDYDEDDEDEEGDSDNAKRRGKVQDEGLAVQTIVVSPDYEGFKDHALALNPRLTPFLAERIAQEQVRRFKELKGHKVRHAQDVHREQCPSGNLCPAIGGKPIILPPRSNNKGEKTQVFLMKGHPDIDEPGVTPTTFQRGIPEPPVSQLPATFECSLCFKERKAMNKPSDWTKHVHEDLQPFTCTFKMCSTEKKSFKRKADWVRHENECHRHLDEWRCNYPECQHVCYRSDNFSQHLIREHKVPDFKNKTRGSISSKIRAQHLDQYGQEEELIAQLHRICRSASTAKPASEPCVFCGAVSSTWKKHGLHLSKHMEAIALPILGLVAGEEVSRDTTISPIRREQVPPVMRSNTFSDVASTDEPQPLTPYSTNGSSYPHISPASQSPMGVPLLQQQIQPQFHPYSMSSSPFQQDLTTSQPIVGASLFTPQQTLSPLDGNMYDPLNYGTNHIGYPDVNEYHQTGQISTHYEDLSQPQSFIAINSSTPSTYPPPTMRRSPAPNQLQPPTLYPVTSQTAGQEYVSSPHSGGSYHHSATPSPRQVRVLPTNDRFEVPRSQAVTSHMLQYSNGEYPNTYAYSEQQVSYGNPLKADSYTDDFQQTTKEQELEATTATLNYNGMTATSMAMNNTMYDQQQFGNYGAPLMPPHPQTYQHFTTD